MHRNVTLRVFAAATIFVGMVLAGGAAFADRDASEELRKMFGMGVHHYNAGQFVKAYEALTRCIDGKTQDPSVYYYRGLALMQLGREEDASEDFTRGAEMEIRSPKSQNQVGYDLMNIQGRLRLKLEEYRTDAKLAAYQYHVNKEDVLRKSPGTPAGGAGFSAGGGYGAGYGEQFAPPGSSPMEGGILDVGDYDGLSGDLDDGGQGTGNDAEPLDLGDGDDGLGGGFDDTDDAGLGGGFDDTDDAGLGGGFDDADDAGLGGGFDDADDAGLGGGFDDADDAGLGGGFDDADDAGLGGGFDDADDAGLGGGFDDADDAGLGDGFDDDEATDADDAMPDIFNDEDAAPPVKKNDKKKPAADTLDGDGGEFGPTPFDDDEEGNLAGGADVDGADEPEEPEEAEDPLF